MAEVHVPIHQPGDRSKLLAAARTARALELVQQAVNENCLGDEPLQLDAADVQALDHCMSELGRRRAAGLRMSLGEVMGEFRAPKPKNDVDDKSKGDDKHKK